MPSRKGYALLLAVALAVFAIGAWRHGAQVVDDAYIALRYARNLVDGHGLVYNPGERVEGYTSLAFALIGAGALALGVPPIAAWKTLSLAAAAAAIVAAARIELSGLERRERAAVPGEETVPDVAAASSAAAALPLSPILLLPLPAFAYWAFGTLEAMVFGGLLLWGVVLGLREVETGAFRGSALLFSLAALTRPEGAPLYAIAALALAAREWRMRRPDLRFLRRHAANAAVVGGVVAAQLLWRVSYYGDWRPNTYYAKVTGGAEQVLTGLAYLGRSLLAFPVLALAIALPLVLRLARPARVRHGAPAGVVATLAAAMVLLVVGLGGDSQPFFRFFVPVLPLLAVLAAWAGRILLEPAPASPAEAETLESPPGRRRRWIPAAVAATLLTVHVAAAHLTTQPYVAFVADRTTRVGADVGRAFAARLDREDLLATNTAGSLPYYAGVRALDTLGLADEAIAKRPVYITSTGWAAHRRGWGEYVLRRRPRVILFYNTAGSREPFYLGDRELLALPGFRFYYRLRTLDIPQTPTGEEARRLARFAGYPFGHDRAGRLRSPDLGLEARFFTRPVRHTVLYEAPVTVTYFEWDRRDEALWEMLGVPTRETAARFVEEAAWRWLAEDGERSHDAAARQRVEAICDSALEAIERGDHARAKALLGAAAAENGRARSPRVFQYVANLGAITGDLHAALAAQKELVRLSPEDALARRNLAHLLSVPAAEFGARAVRSAS
jgi:arabinofuranosyltransferase